MDALSCIAYISDGWVTLHLQGLQLCLQSLHLFQVQLEPCLIKMLT